MKSVILFRHGKSDWNASYGSDHERPLSKRGVHAAMRMGRFLAEKNQIPDLVISSTALRAQSTAKLAINSALTGILKLCLKVVYMEVHQIIF